MRISSPPLARPASTPLATIHLSRREGQVLRGLANGLAYKQIGHELGISLDTVRTYVRSLYRKLDVHSVGEAVSRAFRLRLVA